MRSRNRKVNNMGRASCLGLLALGLLLVNPVISSSAFAEEVAEDFEESGNSNDTTNSDAQATNIAMIEADETANYDDQIITMAETASTVTISFLPTAATGSVVPTDTTTGDKAKVDVKVTVRVQNSGGYSVYVGSSSSQLKSGSNVIDSVDSATTYTNLPINRWGYAFIKNGVSSTDSTTYSAMPATLKSTVLDSNTSTNIADETRTYILSFAARIGSDKPAGTYSNSVTMSVVSSPLSVAEEVAYDFSGITDMQAMTTAICAAAPTGGVKQLRDTRDGKYYWIGKMKDGKCWMTQNLDLDLSTSKTLTSADSDVTSSYTPVYNTEKIANSSTILADNAGQRSWSLGDYSIINPTSSISCGDGLESAEACSGSDTKDRFKYYITPTTANGDTNAHYILGNHYQWNTATAGTGGPISSGQASNSICPKGWRLPTSNSTTVGTFGGLIDAYEIDKDVAKLVSAPLYFVTSGEVSQGTTLFLKAGDGGYYWSSTPYSSSSNSVVSAYYLYFSATANARIVPSGNVFTNNRRYGRSVRCVAR